MRRPSRSGVRSGGHSDRGRRTPGRARCDREPGRIARRLPCASCQRAELNRDRASSSGDRRRRRTERELARRGVLTQLKSGVADRDLSRSRYRHRIGGHRVWDRRLTLPAHVRDRHPRRARADRPRAVSRRGDCERSLTASRREVGRRWRPDLDLTFHGGRRRNRR